MMFLYFCAFGQWISNYHPTFIVANKYLTKFIIPHTHTHTHTHVYYIEPRCCAASSRTASLSTPHRVCMSGGTRRHK